MADEIANIVRQWDGPRYLAMLFAPDDKREGLMALHAFNAEVCRIPLLVSDPQVGLIRLQWWRDTLEAIGRGEAQAHPVAIAVAEAISLHHLPLQPLLELVDAHEHDLYADPMPDMLSLEEYLGKTSSVLIQLSAMILDPASAAGVSEAAGNAGVAYGLAQIVNDPRRHANLIPPSETPTSLAECARKRLTEAALAHVPRQHLPAFLYVSLTDLFLAYPGKTLSPWRIQWRLWRAARRESFQLQ
jgi:phytoene/squalene synthetase